MFALIPAAGSGSRAASAARGRPDPPEPKQYALLAGRPMLWHAIRAVCVPPVQSVFVVLAPEDRTFPAQDWSAFGDRVEPLYCGGESRRDSVHNGLLATMDEVDAADWVLVHDGARPCLSTRDLERLIAACEDDEVGGILALPVAETVKRAAEERIQATADRSELWLAQTPQMFRAGLLMHALRQARGRITDEASAVEQLGLKPKLVQGSRDNLKVTWPEDLAIAEAILGRRA
jgi:2-C-methyl-D-erythritol 4-phosphate cytidylyltransferase